MIHIRVNIGLKGDKVETDVDPTHTVAALKEHLATLCDVPPAQQRLIFAGHVLKDDRSIGSYSFVSLLLCFSVCVCVLCACVPDVCQSASARDWLVH
jgi:Ubiquitin family